MIIENDILVELRSMNSKLADMSRSMPYTVPAGYFDQLANDMADGVTAAYGAEPVLTWTRQMPYPVPAGYFEQLPMTVAARTYMEEKELLLPKQAPHTVPQGYFEQLPAQILKAAKGAEESNTQTTTIPLGNTTRKAIRWAAAAIVILGIGIGSYKMLQPAEAGINPQTALAAIPESTINEYVQQHIDEFDMEMIENTVAGSNSNISNTHILSDEDIIEYLDETGWEQTVVF